MEWKFFGCFFCLTLCIELLLCIPILKIINKVRKKNYDKIETKIIAKKVGEKHFADFDISDSSDPRSMAIYEWIYNGKKHNLNVYDRSGPYRVSVGGGTFSDTLEITINKKTGEYKVPQKEKVVHRLNVFTFLISCVIAYYLSILITGINPIAN